MEKNQALMHFYFTTLTLNALKTAPKAESEKYFADLLNKSFTGFSLNLSQMVDFVMFTS